MEMEEIKSFELVINIDFGREATFIINPLYNTISVQGTREMHQLVKWHAVWNIKDECIRILNIHREDTPSCLHAQMEWKTGNLYIIHSIDYSWLLVCDLAQAIQ
jgi:hypothetical protein